MSGLAILAVVCCAGPLVAAAVLASGIGVWIAAHSLLVGVVALIAIAAAVTGIRTLSCRR